MQRPGVTLLELLIVMGIGAILSGLILSANIDQLRVQRLAIQRSEIENSTRNALRRVVKTIRDAQASSTGGFAIANPGTQTFSFYSNIDADAGIELVRYFLNGTLLQRGVIQPVGSPATYPGGSEVISTVTTNIRNGAAVLFEYFDEDYLGSQSPLTQPVTATAVRLVRVTLTVDADVNQAPPASTIITNVQLRNLKNNY